MSGYNEKNLFLKHDNFLNISVKRTKQIVYDAGVFDNFNGKVEGFKFILNFGKAKEKL